MQAAPALFHRLVDDAALFPPGNAAMADAVPGHGQFLASAHADLVGPFLCPSSRLDELVDELQHVERLDLGLIVDTGLEDVERASAAAVADDRIALAIVEVPLPTGADLPLETERAIRGSPPGVRLHVELPRSPGWPQALDVLAAAGHGAKLRTGGMRAELFPTDAELGAFIIACAERAVPFKCTAGLHHAVCHTDPDTGWHHHGFLNILVATSRALTGGDVDDALGEARPEVLAAEAASIDPTTAAATRALFRSYGSCNIDEPVDDLRQLGLIR